MRNTKLIAIILSLGSIAACQSKDDIYVGPPEDENDKVTDLIVPEGFDWKMSQDVGLSIESNVESMVDVFRSSDCKTEDLIATLNVPTEEVILSVPMSTDKLYIQYSKTDGNKSILPVTLTESRAANHGKGHAQLPEDAGEIKGDGVLYYPSNGWGTVLLEDNWPEKGDYDLNDFTAWYKIQQYITGKNNKKAEAILVSVTMTAMGGNFPYQLCLGINGLKYKEISELVEYGTNNYKAILSELNNGDAILIYNWDKLKGSEGGNYYNTEDNYTPVNKEKLKKNQVSYMIYLENSMNAFSHEDFDFFLKRKDNGTEVHLKGYKPSTDFMPTYNEITNSNPDLANNQYYVTTDGFVWGIKVPKGIGHSKERIDITEAYPDFAAWVTSGGTSQGEWYNKANKDKCVIVEID